MVHAALLLMLGARTTVTPFHHQPEAQHPKNLSAIHKLPADYPIFVPEADIYRFLRLLTGQVQISRQPNGT
jgi:hypothetical protein